MTTGFSDLFELVVGHTIVAVEPRGDAGWAIVTERVVVHATTWSTNGETPIKGQKVVAAIRGASERDWSLLLDDNTIVALDVREVLPRDKPSRDLS